MTLPSQPVEGQTNNNDTAAANASVKACPNCHSEMLEQMRFCRMCGYRLGEGVAEYAETVRLQQPTQGTPRPFQTDSRNQARGTNGQPASMPGSYRDLNRMAHQAGQRAFNQSRNKLSARSKRRCSNSWPHWFIWPIIGLTMSIAAAGNHVTNSIWHRVPVARTRTNAPQPPAIPPLPVVEFEESVIGTNQLKNAEGGVSFESVTPGSAADQAGLVGGDIINSFDGHPVKDSDQLEELLGHTPAGKTVPVVFTRDGKRETTNLKTISEEENNLLEDQSEERAEGQGYIGEGTDLDSVRVPGMNIEGVRLGEIRKNNPAYIAGLRDGDIIIEFNDTPIRTRKEFESRIQRAFPGSTARTIVIRDGQRLEIPVKVGQED